MSRSRKANFKRAAQKRREVRANARRAEKKVEQAAWAADAPIREAKNIERLSNETLLLVKVDGEVYSGLVQHNGSWEYLRRDGLATPEPLFDDPVLATLWLYADVSYKREYQPSSMVEVEERHASATAFLSDIREKLHVAFYAGELDNRIIDPCLCDATDLFLDHFADETARRAIEERRANGDYR
ncbi:hypothetical protein ACFONN_17380 [Dyella humi]|uniref:Uncharacterized protein n=1 Tax=Dyella humi TaxID=1770547 RepID=A0ABW8IDB9_9GAMM